MALVLRYRLEPVLLGRNLDLVAAFARMRGWQAKGNCKMQIAKCKLAICILQFPMRQGCDAGDCDGAEQSFNPTHRHPLLRNRPSLRRFAPRSRTGPRSASGPASAVLESLR